MDNTNEKSSSSTTKIIICTVIIACILVLVYYIFCYYSSEDDGFLSSGSKSDISVGWNIEEMIEKIHNRQKVNLSRLSKNSNYNI